MGTEQAVRAELDRLGDALGAAGVAKPLAERVRIVLAEVFNNIVEHAYAQQDAGPIRAAITHGDSTITCDIRDRGAPFAKGALPGQTWPPIDPDTPDTWPEGGFGWAMVRELTQDLSYRHRAGENILQFRIQRD